MAMTQETKSVVSKEEVFDKKAGGLRIRAKVKP